MQQPSTVKDRAAASSVVDGSRIWLPQLVERFASLMGGNDIPCNLRLIDKATAALFRGRPEYTTVRLSQPVPHHAFVRRWGAPGATRSLNRSQRHQLVRLTAASGSVVNLEVAVAAVGGPLVACDSGMLGSAARAGKVKVCRWLLRHGYGLAEVGTAAEAAARGGQQEAVEFLLAKWTDWNWDLLCAAARGGHPALVDWLLLRRPKGPLGPNDSLRALLGDDGPRLFIAFAEGCSLEELQAVHRRVDTSKPPGRAICYARALAAAAGSPTADWQAKVEWLEAAEPAARVAVPELCDAAAKCPDALDRLRWLRQRGYRMTRCTAWEAFKNGDVAVLEYVLAEGLTVGEGDSEWMAKPAAREGRLETLKLLHAHGCLGNVDEVARLAAQSGHLPVLTWAVEELGLAVPSAHGPGLMTDAARSGSVELHAWLHERGCSLDRWTFEAAAGSGCEAALEWLAEHGCPMGNDGDPYLGIECCGFDLPMLHCLRRLGCPWGPVGRVFNWYLQMDHEVPELRCLVEAGCPIDWEAALRVATRGGGSCSAEVVSWLEEQCREQQPAAHVDG